MILTSEQINAIYKLYPNVVRTVGVVATDVNGNQIEYDLDAVFAQTQADAQTEVAAKESALSKLTALGLTADEVKALLGAA
jgi:hypothetical protein